MTQLQLMLNGIVRADVDVADMSLLEYLRTRTGIASTKDGCSPQGSCGACTVLIDGNPRPACVTPLAACKDRSILTVEGIPDAVELARSLVASGAVQCGFCIPGIIVRSAWLLRRDKHPSDVAIRRALDNHFCRCTGYASIVEGIRSHTRGPKLTDAVASHRYRGVELALGREAFVDDVPVEGCLFAALRFSDHPRARVNAINTAPALRIPGVIRVVTANDVPGKRFVGLLHDDWPLFVDIHEETQYIGDVIAAVIAETESAARLAAAHLEVSYDVLTPVSSTAVAMGVKAFCIDDDLPESPAVVSTTVVAKGNVSAISRRAMIRITETFSTPAIEQAFLEPESSVALFDDDGCIRVLSQGQGVFDDRRQIAQILDVREERVRVQLMPTGGAFGGKEDLSIQAHTALMAFLIGKPVRLRLSRAESIRLHPKRHPFEMHYEIFAGADGALVGLRALLIGDSGAYSSVSEKVLERAATHACGVYRIPNVHVRAAAIRTNNPPSGAMRGFGVPQVTLAIEGMMDRLAVTAGVDAWEIRSRNVLRPGDTWSTGAAITDCQGISDALHAVREAYYSHSTTGIACGMKNVGLGNGASECASVKLAVRRGIVEIITGFSEMGQGLFTALCRLASQSTGLPIDRFLVRCDTTYPVDSGMTTASRATFLAGRAVMAAGRALKRELDAGLTLDTLSGRIFADEYRAPATTLEHDTSLPNHFAFAFAAQVVILDERGVVEEIVAAHDVGTAINPMLLQSQLEGSIHMGLGYALTEEFEYRGCVPETFNLRRLGVIRARYMPRITLLDVSSPSTEGPNGARGAGEIGLVPTAAAVAGAVSRFEGRFRRCLPLSKSAASAYAKGHMDQFEI